MRLPALLACLALCSPAFGQNDATPLAETRGTWLTTTANDAISTPAKTAETMTKLRELGLNTVYVECWKNGYTEFPSKTMDDLIGVPMKVSAAPADLQRDLLQEAVIEAHRNGLLAVAWFEYGFMAAHKDTHNELRKVAEQKGWLTTTKAGEEVGKQNPFVWMNPLHPRPQDLLLNIVLEAVDAYDLDGVQLDDRIAMPVEMGYDPYTKELYAEEHGGRMPPEDERDAAWVQWRADKVSLYAKEFAIKLKQRRPGLIVSVSPAPYRWSLDNYACDWPTWMAWQTDAGRPLWDEFIPQCYRMTGPATIDSFREQIDAVRTVGDGNLKRLVPGVRLVGDGPDLPEKDLDDVVTFARQKGLGGTVLWFSRGVLEVMPQAVRAAHERPAHNALRPADWRPMPTVATRDGDGWKATITRPGTYRALAKFDGRWKVGQANAYEAGTIHVDAAGAEAVEFLIDRRPEMNAQ